MRGRAWREGANRRAAFLRAAFLRWLGALSPAARSAACGMRQYDQDQLRSWIASPNRAGPAPPTETPRRPRWQLCPRWYSGTTASTADAAACVAV
eukprot:80299-Pyramimonas_sp.AAC.1